MRDPLPSSDHRMATLTGAVNGEGARKKCRHRSRSVNMEQGAQTQKKVDPALCALDSLPNVQEMGGAEKQQENPTRGRGGLGSLQTHMRPASKNYQFD